MWVVNDNETKIHIFNQFVSETFSTERDIYVNGFKKTVYYFNVLIYPCSQKTVTNNPPLLKIMLNE